MARINLENIGGVVDSGVRKARILKLYPDDDTADVELVDTGERYSRVPIFYHCYPDAKQRENGALEGAAAAFEEGDTVFVKFKVKEKLQDPVILSGIQLRPCESYDILVFYAEDGIKAALLDTERGKIISDLTPETLAEKGFGGWDYVFYLLDSEVVDCISTYYSNEGTLFSIFSRKPEGYKIAYYLLKDKQLRLIRLHTFPGNVPYGPWCSLCSLSKDGKVFIYERYYDQGLKRFLMRYGTTGELEAYRELSIHEPNELIFAGFFNGKESFYDFSYKQFSAALTREGEVYEVLKDGKLLYATFEEIKIEEFDAPVIVVDLINSVKLISLDKVTSGFRSSFFNRLEQLGYSEQHEHCPAYVEEASGLKLEEIGFPDNNHVTWGKGYYDYDLFDVTVYRWISDVKAIFPRATNDWAVGWIESLDTYLADRVTVFTQSYLPAGMDVYTCWSAGESFIFLRSPDESPDSWIEAQVPLGNREREGNVIVKLDEDVHEYNDKSPAGYAHLEINKYFQRNLQAYSDIEGEELYFEHVKLEDRSIYRVKRQEGWKDISNLFSSLSAPFAVVVLEVKK